ncbi:MAG: hypothetical protein P8Y18_02660 [Candidatus Bathyarchaeota archaeon]
MDLKINWFGFFGSISLFILVIVSLVVPWWQWQLNVGDDLDVANASPINTNFSLIGNSLTIPIILALNITSVISFTASGIVMFIYSVKTLESYSSKLLSFAYRKPLYSIVLFIVGLIISIFVASSFFGFNVPLLGSKLSILPYDMTQGVTVNVSMNAGFQWPFILAIVGVFSVLQQGFITKILFKAAPQQPCSKLKIWIPTFLVLLQMNYSYMLKIF